MHNNTKQHQEEEKNKFMGFRKPQVENKKQLNSFWGLVDRAKEALEIVDKAMNCNPLNLTVEDFIEVIPTELITRIDKKHIYDITKNSKNAKNREENIKTALREQLALHGEVEIKISGYDKPITLTNYPNMNKILQANDYLQNMLYGMISAEIIRDTQHLGGGASINLSLMLTTLSAASKIARLYTNPLDNGVAEAAYAIANYCNSHQDFSCCNNGFLQVCFSMKLLNSKEFCHNTALTK